MTDTRLYVRWYQGGDYTIHYLETRATDDRQCRWERHLKPEAPRTHFHPPPEAAAAAVESGIGEHHHLGVLFAVLEWVESHVATLHSDP